MMNRYAKPQGFDRCRSTINVQQQISSIPKTQDLLKQQREQENAKRKHFKNLADKQESGNENLFQAPQ